MTKSMDQFYTISKQFQFFSANAENREHWRAKMPWNPMEQGRKCHFITYCLNKPVQRVQCKQLAAITEGCNFSVK